MHEMKARQCTLNGRREWRTTMGDRRFFRTRSPFPARIHRPLRAGPDLRSVGPHGRDWTRVPAPLLAANRDFRNRGIKNPDNCGRSLFRDGGIDRFLPNGLEHLEPPRYRVTDHLGTLLLLRMRCLGTIASSTKVSMEFLLRAGIDFFRLLVTRSSKSYISFFSVLLFIEEYRDAELDITYWILFYNRICG